MSNEYKPTYVDNTDNSISIMESTDTISFCKTGTKINTLSAKNVAHKKTGEDLNLCAYDGSSFNPVITINNNNQDCRIMTNLNVSGNVNINSNGTWVNALLGPSLLYSFSSHIFTSAGLTGTTGPTLTQSQNAYVGNIWTINRNFFNVVYGGYQIWTVPQTGNYRIKAYGAGGGWRRDNSHSYKRGPGLGAVTQGNFSLNKEEKLLIIIGQHSPTTNLGYVYAGGGGGATWVLRGDQWEAIDNNLYCVAGGGGGETSQPVQQADGQITVEHGKIEQSSVVTNWSSVQSTSDGIGGAYGGGGGSYGIKGGEGTVANDSAGPGGAPYDTTLAIGGDSSYPPNWEGSNVGGFGGGGGSALQNGGGGGGYIGGDTGSYQYYGGHGGSSRNNGTSILFSNHSMHNGAVEITFISEISIPTPLYNFTSPQTFGNYGALGQDGPTLVMATGGSGLVGADEWKNNLAYFNVINGIQYWTVPKSGSYRIFAYGGDALERSGGKGAIIGGTFTLERGEIIRILVGQRPEPYNTSNGGGGGGTFVVRAPYNTDSSILVIAGGGGGQHSLPGWSDNLNRHGQAPRVGGEGGMGVMTNDIYGKMGGTKGSAGEIGSDYNAGAGFYGSMSDDSGAKAFTDTNTPGRGGTIYSYEGGFGCGGRHGGSHGGGGGGYSGGAGSYGYPYQGGGGGSYNNGFNQAAYVGQDGWNNQGKVEITFIEENSYFYNLTSPQTFGNYGAVGKNGPTLSMAIGGSGLVGANDWKNNLAYFNVINGIQYWTVPKSGNYTIKAYGADAEARLGGRGAIITGTFTLTVGEIIRILVGQRPDWYSTSNGGAGGGTFVVRAPYNTDSSILVIAGGGGGGHFYSDAPRLDLNMHGQAGSNGGSGTGSGSVRATPLYNISGGTNGLEGTIGYDYNAGAGFYGSINDNSGARAFTSPWDPSTPGMGGHAASESLGGFGCGGRQGNNHGGGGGGYSGGGGSNTDPYQGGGGGSYNNGLNKIAEVGKDNGWLGQGKVEITFMPELPIAPTPLYNFTSQTFGNYGAVGKKGPTLIMATGVNGLVGADDWKNNLAYFNVANGIQYWTVPKSGNYTIKAYGADSRVRGGGWGAIVTGNFSLVRDEIIRILVGQRPEPYTNTNGGGGAGGTFVVKAPYNTDDSILVIAGGAGGGFGSLTNPAPSLLQNANGQIGTSGGNGTDSTSGTPSFGVPGGTNGYGGQVQNANWGNRSGSGAGFYGNGMVPFTTYEIAQAFVSVTPGLGAEKTSGPVTTNFGEGGFGGGARIGQTNGGGGGGYSGGGGASNDSNGYGPWTAGGGGSYNNDSNGTAETGEINGWVGQGKVEITFIS